MGTVATVAKGNIFYKARIDSKHSDCTNRTSASETLCMGKRRLEEIETSRTYPYTDEVIRMADIYNAPYLIEHYCNHICEIGKQFGCKYATEKSDAYKATVMFVHSLKEAEQAKEQIIEILSDGRITTDEIEILDRSISQLTETMTDIINLKIALEEEKIKPRR